MTLLGIVLRGMGIAILGYSGAAVFVVGQDLQRHVPGVCGASHHDPGQQIWVVLVVYPATTHGGGSQIARLPNHLGVSVVIPAIGITKMPDRGAQFGLQYRFGFLHLGQGLRVIGHL